MNKPIKLISTYDDIAAEYYDPVRHPTCANFGELSSQFLAPRITALAQRGDRILEVGAGRSIVATILESKPGLLTNLTLLDQSPAMLEHSRKWTAMGVKLVVADACSTSLRAFGFDLIVSSLGDPYNFPSFWGEIDRLLDRKGVCLFTLPASEWAARFRVGSDPATAEFQLLNGAKALVRSNVPPKNKQIKLIEEAGLRVDEVVELSVANLTSTVSPKLLVNKNTAHLPVVRGFMIKAV